MQMTGVRHMAAEDYTIFQREWGCVYVCDSGTNKQREADDGVRVREWHGNLLKLPMRTIGRVWRDPGDAAACHSARCPCWYLSLAAARKLIAAVEWGISWDLVKKLDLPLSNQSIAPNSFKLTHRNIFPKPAGVISHIHPLCLSHWKQTDQNFYRQQ